MKRFIVILFTAFYASLSLGVDLNLHYCGGKLAAVTIALPAPSCCCDAMASQSDCCEDAQLSVQMDMDQIHLASSNWPNVDFSGPTIQGILDQVSLEIKGEKSFLPYLPNPPPISGQLLRIQMGALTYYG